MPPKTVKCIICGNEVMKSQTSFIPKGFSYIEGGFGKKTEQDGRACNHHPGVTEKKDEQREVQRKQALEPSDHGKCVEEQRKKIQKENETFLSSRPQRNPRAFCWTCGKDGTEHQDYLIQRLIAMKELELAGDTSWVLNPQVITDKIKENGFLPPIIGLQIDIRDEDLMRRIKRDMQTLAEMLQHVFMCPGCIKNLNMMKVYEEQFMKKNENISLDAMISMAAAMEVSGVNETLSNAARANMMFKETPKQ